MTAHDEAPERADDEMRDYAELLRAYDDAAHKDAFDKRDRLTLEVAIDTRDALREIAGHLAEIAAALHPATDNEIDPAEYGEGKDGND